MRNIFIFILGLFLFSSCNSEETQKAQTAEKANVEVGFVDEKSVLATHVAVFEVEGMMCQKGCGSILRKGLYETGGVAEVDVTFDEDSPVNKIKVHFDNKKTSIEEMITLVGTLANEQYSARLIGVSERTVDNSTL